MEVRDSPYPHVGPLLQPAQAGKFRVRVPSPAPPPASFLLSQPSSSSVKEGSATVPIQAPGKGRHSLAPAYLRHLQQLLPWTGGTWVSLPSLGLPALLNLDSGEHLWLSYIPADSSQLWEKQKWERQAALIGTGPEPAERLRGPLSQRLWKSTLYQPPHPAVCPCIRLPSHIFIPGTS